MGALADALRKKYRTPSEALIALGLDESILKGGLNRKENQMSKIVLTRKGTFLAGAVAAYLLPKLAQDSKLDVAPLFKGVTAKNFSDKKAKIAEDIKKGAKLAQDATIDDLTLLLDKLDDQEIAEGADMDPSSGLPMSKEDMDKKAKDAAEEETKKKAMDRQAARDAKMADFKKAQGLDEEECKALDELMGELDGMDGDEPEPMPAAKKAEDDAGEPKVTAKAMDAAIAKATKEATANALRTANEIAEAKDVASKWVGRLAMDAVSPADVYKAALDHLEIDLKDVHPSAFRKILEAQPLPGAREDRLANDSNPDSTGFTKRFGGLVDRIGHAG